MIFLQFEIHISNNSSSSFKDFLPLISVVVTLLLFITDRLIAIRVRRREVERNWYLKVLVEPNLIRINDFFDTVGKTYEESAKFLTLNLTKTHEEYVTIKAQEFEKFIDLKRILIAYLIYPLSPRYPEISERIDLVLQDTEDDFTTNLDKDAFSIENINDFKLRSYNKKAKLLNILYTPLGKKKKV